MELSQKSEGKTGLDFQNGLWQGGKNKLRVFAKVYDHTPTCLYRSVCAHADSIKTVPGVLFQLSVWQTGHMV